MNTLYRLIIITVSLHGMQQVFSSAPTQSIKPVDVSSAEERRAILEASINEVLKEETQDAQKKDIDNCATSSEEVEHVAPVLSDRILSPELRALEMRELPRSASLRKAFKGSGQEKINNLFLEAERSRPAPTRIIKGADGSITTEYPGMIIIDYPANYFDLSETREQRPYGFIPLDDLRDIRGETLRVLSEEESLEHIRQNYPALSENNEQYDPSADDDLYATS